MLFRLVAHIKTPVRSDKNSWNIVAPVLTNFQNGLDAVAVVQMIICDDGIWRAGAIGKKRLKAIKRSGTEYRTAPSAQKYSKSVQDCWFVVDAQDGQAVQCQRRRNDRLIAACQLNTFRRGSRP